MNQINSYLAQMADSARQMQAIAEEQKLQRAREMERLRGIKTGFRLPKLQKTGSNPFSMGGDTNTPAGQTPQKPDEGYAWALRHLVITGLTAGATPDRIQITRGGDVIWELNGNQYAQTWGRGELWIKPGESLGYQSVSGATFASVAQIQVTGAVDEFPAEAAAKAVD